MSVVFAAVTGGAAIVSVGTAVFIHVPPMSLMEETSPSVTVALAVGFVGQSAAVAVTVTTGAVVYPKPLEVRVACVPPAYTVAVAVCALVGLTLIKKV